MTADEPRAHAEADRADAGEHRAQYDPNAATTRVVPKVVRAGEVAYPVDVYNPTEEHAREAAVLEAEAKRHEKAAAKLEAWEDAACADAPTAARAACPLLVGVVAVDDVPRGARVRLRDGVDRAALVARMRCHAAFAAAQGGDAQGCPLYVKGVQIDDEGGWIVFRARGADEAATIRRELRSHGVVH